MGPWAAWASKGQPAHSRSWGWVGFEVRSDPTVIPWNTLPGDREGRAQANTIWVQRKPTSRFHCHTITCSSGVTTWPQRRHSCQIKAHPSTQIWEPELSDGESGEPRHPEAANHPLCPWGLRLQGMHTAVWSLPVSGNSVRRWMMTEPQTHQKAKQELLQVKARPPHSQTSKPALAGSCCARGATPGKPRVDIQALSTHSIKAV